MAPPARIGMGPVPRGVEEDPELKRLRLQVIMGRLFLCRSCGNRAPMSDPIFVVTKDGNYSLHPLWVIILAREHFLGRWLKAGFTWGGGRGGEGRH